MSSFIDFSAVIDLQRERRLEAQRTAEAARMDAEIATADLGQEQEQSMRRKGLNELQKARRADKEPPLTSVTTSTFNQAAQTAGVRPVGSPLARQPILPRLGRLQKVKEFFRPGLRRKRVLEELAIAESIEPATEGPMEVPSLPGAGLLKLQAMEENSLPASPLDNSFVAEMTPGDDDDTEEITALPPLPGAGGRFHTLIPAHAHQQVEELSVEDLADQAMEDAEAAYDAPGNRLSARLPVPIGWRFAGELTRSADTGGSEQQILTALNDFLPLPDLSGPGLPLPSCLVPNSGPATARSTTQDAADDAQTTTGSANGSLASARTS